MRVIPQNIIHCLKAGKGIRETARELGVSPATVLNWKRRASGSYVRQPLKVVGLARKSTAPHHRNKTHLSLEQRAKILQLREEEGWSARRIGSKLELEWHQVHRFLDRKELIRSAPNYLRPRFQPTTHMHLKNVNQPGFLQMDVKFVTPELSGLPHTNFLVALIDIYSRWKVGAIFTNHTEIESMMALEAALKVLPFPVSFVQTDNGFEFMKRFHAHCQTLGLDHHHIHKSSPNENAVIERSFRTDEEEFFTFRLPRWGRPKDLLELNEKYASYLHHYNTERPHYGLGFLTPEQKLKQYQN